jgi:putative endopeptidase
MVQGGLGLDREDYLDPAKAGRLDLYRARVAAALRLAGLSDPDTRAERILALETALARTHGSRADTDDVFKTDNPWRRADFDARAPGMDWTAYFQSAGLGRQADFVVWQPSAVVGLSKLVAGEPLEAWKDYLAFHLIDHDTPVLPKAFGEEKRAFAARLTGRTPAMPDATAEAIAATEAAMGDAVGRLYVARYFSPFDKAAAAAMAENLRTAWRARLSTADWMEPVTKAKAQAKLDTLHVDIGYPATWIDYSSLSVVRGDAFGNLRRAEAFAWRHELAKLAQPVDRDEWIAGFYPQQIAGFLYFSPNTELFTAGLLQPPYFDAHGDAAANYGSAGAAMAHEIGHTFDELGADYDAQGRLTHWWTKEDLARFRAATAPLAAQYDAYCPRPSLCLKGQQLLSEDAADLAGLRVAHDAYILSLHGKPAPVIGGLTGDQRFFLTFARRWRRLQSDEALLRQIATDTHAPGEFRADTVRNVDAWQRAFGVKPGDRLYLGPDKQIRIW